MSTLTFERDDDAPRPEENPKEITPGAQLGRYELIRPIGKGGMGDVWLARQTGGYGFRRLVALKTIRPELAQKASFRRLFLFEAHAAAAIHHTNVVEVLDLAEDDGVLYQAMPLVEGATLRAMIDASSGRLPVDAMARVAVHVARGLHAAHTASDERGRPLGLVHRDVSPHNILCGVDGFAKLGDFGVARALGRASIAAGKRKYMAPEQLAGADVDARADVYALGIVMRVALGSSGALAPVIRCATARERAARFATAEQLADAIEDAVTIASAKVLGDLVRELCPERAVQLASYRAA